MENDHLRHELAPEAARLSLNLHLIEVQLVKGIEHTLVGSAARVEEELQHFGLLAPENRRINVGIQYLEFDF